jgi:hypothetical protein
MRNRQVEVEVEEGYQIGKAKTLVDTPEAI